MDFFDFHLTTVWLWKLLILLGVSIISGIILSVTYQIGNKKDQQPAQPFGWLIVIMPSLVSVIIFIVEDNFLRAVFLLGATTLIRFRNPVKNPLNTILILATVGTGASAGFGFYTVSIVLALLCFLIIWIDCHFINRAGMYVNRLLYLDCHYSHHPDMVLKDMGKWLRKWTKLSVETSASGDHLYWYYQVQIRKEGEMRGRIRRYGDIAPWERVFVEIKRRKGQYIEKSRFPLETQLLPFLFNLSQKDRITQTLNQAGIQVYNEVISLARLFHLRPVVFIRYKRKAFWAKGEERLRITFDSDLSYDVVNQNCLSPLENTQPILDGDQVVMEIKANGRVPFWVLEIIKEFECRMMRLSKYCLGVQMAHGLGGSYFAYSKKEATLSSTGGAHA